MSSEPDGAESASGAAGDSPALPTSESSTNPAAEASSNPAGEPPGAKRPIRIGTQRYGTKAPPAVAKPLLASPSLTRRVGADDTVNVEAPQAEAPRAYVSEAAADTAGETAQPAALAAETNEAETSTAAASTGAASTGAARDRPDARRGDRGRRDKQKPREPKHFNEYEQPERKYPPPNIRSQLSPELELEFLEALGDQPVDEIMAKGRTAEQVVELEPESRHKGRVVSVHRDNVFVEIAGLYQGIVPLKNFADPPEPGTMLDLMVSRFNGAEGLYELVLPGSAIDVGDWSEVAEGMVVEARVTGHNKGGLECEVNRLRGFIPASQVSLYRVEDLAQFVDQKFHCVITEANPEKRNLVLSRRAMLEREKAEAKEALMGQLEVGQQREGVVRSLQSFGAFVDLGGVDGLIHISQLSWDRIKHAEEVLQLGQTVKVKIQKIDPQTGKIGLAFRDLSESPWANASRDFPARSTVHGTVSRLMEFGAFVRLTAGVEGLIHISELSHRRVFRVSDVVQEGQEVDVQVLSVDTENQRISLSLKALEARAVPVEKAAEPEEPEAPPEPPKKRKVPLKGGTGGPATGEKFGLKW